MSPVLLNEKLCLRDYIFYVLCVYSGAVSSVFTRIPTEALDVVCTKCIPQGRRLAP
jgi:hypothetical protein